MVRSQLAVLSLGLGIFAPRSDAFKAQPFRSAVASNATVGVHAPSRSLPLGNRAYPRPTPRLSAVADPLSSENRGMEPTKEAGLFSRMGKGYMARLEKKPIITKVITAIFLSAISDAIGQMITAAPGDPFNIQRFVAFVASQSFILTPMCHYLLEGIEKWGQFASKYVGKKGKPFAMVALDQTLSATTVFTMFYLSFTVFEAALYGFPAGALASVNDGWDKVVRTIVPTMFASWKIWPAANLFNFSYMPISLRLPFISTVSCGFNIVLSILASK